MESRYYPPPTHTTVFLLPHHLQPRASEKSMALRTMSALATPSLSPEAGPGHAPPFSAPNSTPEAAHHTTRGSAHPGSPRRPAPTCRAWGWSRWGGLHWRWRRGKASATCCARANKPMQRFDSTVWSIRAVGGFHSGYRQRLAPRTYAFRCPGVGPLPRPPIHPGPRPRPAPAALQQVRWRRAPPAAFKRSRRRRTGDKIKKIVVIPTLCVASRSVEC